MNSQQKEAIATFLDESEAAEYLGVSLSGLRKWRARGVGPRYCRFSRLIRYPLVELIRFAESRMVETKTPMQGGADVKEGN